MDEYIIVSFKGFWNMCTCKWTPDFNEATRYNSEDSMFAYACLKAVEPSVVTQKVG